MYERNELQLSNCLHIMYKKLQNVKSILAWLKTFVKSLIISGFYGSFFLEPAIHELAVRKPCMREKLRAKLQIRL